MKFLRLSVVILGWMIAVYIALIPFFLMREYGWGSVGWGPITFCVTPVALMLFGWVRGRRRKASPR